jgi:acetylglutamate kinase
LFNCPTSFTLLKKHCSTVFYPCLTMTHESEYFREAEATRVRVLSEALPYIQQLAGKTIVVKYGGAAMKDSSLKDRVIRDVVLMSCVGLRPVVVHGGGPEINTWLDKLGIEPQFKNGLRVTDAPTMDVVEMVLVGRVNKELVALINQAGGKAVGLCGKDANLIKARPSDAEGVGFVGEVTSVDTRILETLVQNGYIPVVSSVAADVNGQAYNINADTAAGEIAAALGAEKLILLTDTAGILRDYKDITTLIPKVDISEARRLIDTGIVSGGMIPKVNCCVRSLAQGVRGAHIVDGRVPHALLLEVFTDEGIGSMIVASEFQR